MGSNRQLYWFRIYRRRNGESEIRERWDDGGRGRGSWILEITASIDTAPIAGGLIDNNEEFDITWTAVFSPF